MSAAPVKNIAASVKNRLLAAAHQSGKPFEGGGERRGRRSTKPEGIDAAARLSHDSGISRRLNDYGRKVDD